MTPTALPLPLDVSKDEYPRVVPCIHSLLFPMDEKAFRDGLLTLDKPSLRRGGPLVFVEYFRTSYDPTPYLAVDQLAFHAQRFDPLRAIQRIQIVEYPDRVEFTQLMKELNSSWRVISGRIVLDVLQHGDIWSRYRGDLNYGSSRIETDLKTRMLSAWNERKLFRVDETLPTLSDISVARVEQGESLAGASSREFAASLRTSRPAVIACTGDSKVFSRIRYYLERAQHELSETLVALGGVHAIAAHHDLVQHLAEDTGLCTPSSQPFDLVHYGSSGELDFCDMLRAFGLPDGERQIALASLPNFSARVHRVADPDPWNSAYITNPSVPRINSEVIRCYSEEQMPTSWGEAQPLVRRLKGSWGCQFACSFCATSRGYSPGDIGRTADFFDSVVKECKERNINPEDVLVYFEDANFAGPYASKVLDLMKGYSFQLGIQIRFDCLTDAMISKIKGGRVGYVFLGLESYDDSLRNSVNKQSNVSPERMLQVAQSLHEEGIEFLVSGIVGLPGEDLDAMARTILFARVLSPRVISLELPKVYPGTELSKECGGQFGLESVGTLYSRGDKLLETHEAGQESAGSLLMPHLREEYAIAIIQEAHEMVLMPLEELRAKAGQTIIAKELVHGSYRSRENDIGFYVR